MTSTATYPTPYHRTAAATVLDYYQHNDNVEAVLVVNSCARGQAVPTSDLDMLVLVAPEVLAAEQANLETDWLRLRQRHPALQALCQLGRFTNIHLDFNDGDYVPETWDDGGGPDSFELLIGNQAAYSALLWERTNACQELRARWLPYYRDNLRAGRLAMITDACRYDLAFVPFYVERGLYFQAFDRLYKAFQEFLQALFIAHRIYPLAYNKWIRMQVVDWLGLPDLYTKLPGVLQIHDLESDELVVRATELTHLVDRWIES